MLDYTTYMSLFKTKLTFVERKKESSSIMEKYPDRVPIICERNPKDTRTPIIGRTKYLVPADLTVGQFLSVVRKYIKVNDNQAIFLFVNGYIPLTSQIIRNLYDYSKDEDGFLYIIYALENTFG